MSKTVHIIYDENNFMTNIKIDGIPFDTSRINNTAIINWIYPFITKSVRWNGIFKELANAAGTNDYIIIFSGSTDAMMILMDKCPDGVEIKMETEESSGSFRQTAVFSGTFKAPAYEFNTDNEIKKIMAILKNDQAASEHQKAFERLISLAEQGNKKAQFNIGECCYYEYAIEGNKEEGIKWYRKAADVYDNAQLALGNCYYNGDGVEINKEEGIKWYRKAAEQGNADAQYKLGYCYSEVKCSEESKEEAVKWYRKAAEQGHRDAQYELGYCYYEGVGIEKNCKEGVKWYRKAAEQGNADAQYELGYCCYNGEGAEENKKEALKWYIKSAEQGNKYAQDTLGFLYDTGNGVKQNYEEAIKWYKKAAEQGNEFARKRIAILEGKFEQ